MRRMLLTRVESAAKPQAPTAAAGSAGKLSIGVDLYKSIAVRPVINATGPITMFGGSIILPEVREAMAQASKRYVQIDELMEAVGHRLAEITGAEFAIVTSGCAAALAHATSARIAGGNPERIRRLPALEGLKDEVVAPVDPGTATIMRFACWASR